MSGASGVSAMIHLAVSFESDYGMEVLSIGRSAVSDESCMLEICGTWLCFRIALRECEVHVAATEMDSGAPPDLLMKAKDDEDGWKSVRSLVAALEQCAIKSLTRPIEARGYDGANSWVIA